MAVILPNLQKIANSFIEKPYLYKDLHLDFNKVRMQNEYLLESIEESDVKVDYDIAAIYNSLRNLFNTKQGQRFLFPTYGLDLYQFLFEPITENNAQTLGELIVRSIEKFEPRVYVEKCIVDPLYEDNQYDITIEIEIPIAKKREALNATLDTKTKSFVFIDTPRTK